MRILLLGKTGQIGWELERSLAPLGEITSPGHTQLDLADARLLRESIHKIRPKVIVNCAAFTDVELAESEVELAQAVNGIAPGVLADEARNLDSALIHFSTDYVFDGKKEQPYIEEDDAAPINTYGKTKLAGENAIKRVGGTYLIFRTSWIYGFKKSNFVTEIIKRAQSEQAIDVVMDQVGSPTWCRMLAEATSMVLAISKAVGFTWLQEKRGTYHLASQGYATRLEFAQEILEYSPHFRDSRKARINPIKSRDYPSVARRPAFSALDSSLFSTTFGIQIPSWKTSLGLALEAST